MLDRKFIRQNPDAVRDALTAKNESGDLDAWLALDTEHLDLLREVEELLKPVEDRTSRLETMAERAFLDTLGGDPELALGARAALDSQSMIVEGILSNTDGTVYIRDAIQGPSHLAEELGRNLAKLLLALGDEELHGLIPAPSQ